MAKYVTRAASYQRTLRGPSGTPRRSRNRDDGKNTENVVRFVQTFRLLVDDGDPALYPPPHPFGRRYVENRKRRRRWWRSPADTKIYPSTLQPLAVLWTLTGWFFRPHSPRFNRVNWNCLLLYGFETIFNLRSYGKQFVRCFLAKRFLCLFFSFLKRWPTS